MRLGAVGGAFHSKLLANSAVETSNKVRVECAVVAPCNTVEATRASDARLWINDAPGMISADVRLALLPSPTASACTSSPTGCGQTDQSGSKSWLLLLLEDDDGRLLQERANISKA